MELDKTDVKILNILQRDGRITNAGLAKQIGISPPAMLERVRRLEASGVIDKYVGDAVMCLFPESADDAVNGALGMLKWLDEYNKGRKRAFYKPIAIGIGINTGILMLGTVGAQNRMDYTVIGDAVNTASRLEALTTTT